MKITIDDIMAIEDPKSREVTLREYNLPKGLPIEMKLIAIYEIYKDVYGDEIGSFDSIMKRLYS